MTVYAYNSHISAEVIADSITEGGKRLTTVKVVVPRIILAELNTHRAFSRNYSSSRAIPAKKLREEVRCDPFVPVYFGANKPGMSAESELRGLRRFLSESFWVMSAKVACLTHWSLEHLGLHKQTCNRVIEPWLSVTGIISSTEWDNFFKLRIHRAAQPEIRHLAECIRDAIQNSTPKELNKTEFHLPFIDEEEQNKFDKSTKIKVSIARCCRASYNNFLGKKSQPEEDVKLYERLKSDGHMSPFEHVAVPFTDGDECRNFRGWTQVRSMIEPTDRTEEYKARLGVEL